MLKAIDYLEDRPVVRLLLNPGRVENAGILESFQDVLASHERDPVQAVQGQVMIAVDVDALSGELEKHLLVQIRHIGLVEFQTFEDALHIDRPEDVLQRRIVHLWSETFEFFGMVVHATW